MDLKQKIKLMTPKQLLGVMIEGLENPSTDAVNMVSYGHVEYIDNIPICVGCAATNALQALAGKKFSIQNIESDITRAEFMGIDIKTLNDIEVFFDCLRRGEMLILQMKCY